MNQEISNKEIECYKSKLTNVNYNSIPVAIFVLDNDLRISAWNKRISEITGFLPNEVLGKKYTIFTDTAFEQYLQLDSGQEINEVFGIDAKIIKENGQEFHVHLNIYWQSDEQNKLIAMTGTFDEIMAGNNMKEALEWQAHINYSFADLTKSIISFNTLEEISDVLIQNLLNLTNAEYALTGFYDSSLRKIIIKCNHPEIFPESLKINDNIIIDKDSSIWGGVLKQKQSLISNSIRNDGLLPSNSTEYENIEKIIAIPALINKDLIGIIAVLNSKRDFSFEHFEIVERMASIYAVACQRIKAEEEIRIILQKEKELGELKSKFILMVSHEYRTPLTAISLSTELLQEYDEKLSKDDKSNHFTRIKQSINYMTRLLDDIILYNKLDAGVMQFMPSMISLKATVLSVAKEIEIMFRERCTIDVIFNGNNDEVYMDERLIRQIFSNLLSNAIKYSDEGSQVDVIINSSDSEVEFIIRDYGIGIPEEGMQNLFEPFYRTSNVGTIPGTGLGLAIVNNSVKMHNGTVRLISRIGLGTTFFINIPLTEK
jgi:PAS domain S-box-containing protein